MLFQAYRFLTAHNFQKVFRSSSHSYPYEPALPTRAVYLATTIMQPPLYANNADTPGFDDDGGSDSVSLAQDDPVSSSRMEISPQQFLQLLNEESNKTLSQPELVQSPQFMEDPFVAKTS